MKHLIYALPSANQHCRTVILATEYLWELLGSLVCDAPATYTTIRGGGASPASPVLARLPFWHPGLTTHECREGPFVYESEIAASGMWCTKSSLSTNLHVLPHQEWDLHGNHKAVAVKHKGTTRAHLDNWKMKVKNFSVLLMIFIGAMCLDALPSAVMVVPPQNTSRRPWPCAMCYVYHYVLCAIHVYNYVRLLWNTPYSFEVEGAALMIDSKSLAQYSLVKN